jgi:hypothetical protein
VTATADRTLTRSTSGFPRRACGQSTKIHPLGAQQHVVRIEIEVHEALAPRRFEPVAFEIEQQRQVVGRPA